MIGARLPGALAVVPLQYGVPEPDRGFRACDECRRLG